MPIIRIYESEKAVTLTDGSLSITITRKGSRRNIGFSKTVTTKIFNRLGYQRTGNWERIDWGYKATFKRS